MPRRAAKQAHSTPERTSVPWDPLIATTVARLNMLVAARDEPAGSPQSYSVIQKDERHLLSRTLADVRCVCKEARDVAALEPLLDFLLGYEYTRSWGGESVFLDPELDRMAHLCNGWGSRVKLHVDSEETAPFPPKLNPETAFPPGTDSQTVFTGNTVDLRDRPFQCNRLYRIKRNAMKTRREVVHVLEKRPHGRSHITLTYIRYPADYSSSSHTVGTNLIPLEWFANQPSLTEGLPAALAWDVKVLVAFIRWNTWFRYQDRLMPCSRHGCRATTIGDVRSAADCAFGRTVSLLECTFNLSTTPQPYWLRAHRDTLKEETFSTEGESAFAPVSFCSTGCCTEASRIFFRDVLCCQPVMELNCIERSFSKPTIYSTLRLALRRNDQVARRQGRKRVETIPLFLRGFTAARLASERANFNVALNTDTALLSMANIVNPMRKQMELLSRGKRHHIPFLELRRLIMFGDGWRDKDFGYMDMEGVTNPDGDLGKILDYIRRVTERQKKLLTTGAAPSWFESLKDRALDVW